MGSREHQAVNDARSAERERQIIDVLMALREGEVTTYGDVAQVAGHPKQARLVGRILATTQVEVPWWRVVNAAGRLVAGDPHLQSQLLRDEGVQIAGDRVTDAPIGRFSRSTPRPRRSAL
jgi:methylated-DNA-protein-cysteine methyltransferase related protein